MGGCDASREIVRRIALIAQLPVKCDLLVATGIVAWRGGAMVRASELRAMVTRSPPDRSTSRNDSQQVIHTHVSLSPSSIIWYRSYRTAVYCFWEGNRRSY